MKQTKQACKRLIRCLALILADLGRVSSFPGGELSFKEKWTGSHTCKSLSIGGGTNSAAFNLILKHPGKTEQNSKMFDCQFLPKQLITLVPTTTLSLRTDINTCQQLQSGQQGSWPKV
jgi:hypothetical protein